MTEEKKPAYKLIQVPTQLGLAIETEDNKQISEAELLVEIANKLSDLKKELTGK